MVVPCLFADGISQVDGADTLITGYLTVDALIWFKLPLRLVAVVCVGRGCEEEQEKSCQSSAKHLRTQRSTAGAVDRCLVLVYRVAFVLRPKRGCIRRGRS